MNVSRITLSIVIVIVSACSLTKKQPDPTRVYLSAPEQDRVKFSGKGAGAGMMLMSAMGPTGIAIGLAIDEGIGKDIGEAAAERKLNFMDMFTQGLVAYSERERKKITVTSDRLAARYEVKILNYGFTTYPGQGDLSSPKIELELIPVAGESQKKQTMLLVYPDDFKSIEGVDIATGQLDVLKKDGEVVESLWKQAINDIAGHITHHIIGQH